MKNLYSSLLVDVIFVPKARPPITGMIISVIIDNEQAKNRACLIYYSGLSGVAIDGILW